MVKVSKKSIVYWIVLVVLGVAINRLISTIAGTFGIPLYLDSIGTMFAAVVGGVCPGMFVGFITNMLGGLSDTSTFYYGTINVLIAGIAGIAAGKGYFEKIQRVFALLPFYLILSIPGSMLSYILFDRQLAPYASLPAAEMFHGMGIPIWLSQILGDFCVELPDKLISLLVAFCLAKLIPEAVKKEFVVISGREGLQDSEGKKGKRSSLRTQVGVLLFLTGLAIVIVAFAISYKTYMEAKVAGFPDWNYDVAKLRTETLLYSGKMLSAVLGLLLCIVSFFMMLANHMVVTPLHKMATEMKRFAYDSDSGRDESVEKIQALDIRTGNEVEELYLAMTKSVKEIDDYIDMTEEQSRTISELHINIITTLADIVESRDETTGYHVKRTAEYCAIIAKKLLEDEKYPEIIDDNYINTLKIAAPLHDIGKVKIPDAILKKPARLTDEEFEVIKTHTTLGKEMLEGAIKTIGENDYLSMAKDIANYHHEWWDGNKRGYPEGISGESIPLAARIMAVADVFDALVSKRPYKEGYPVEKALDIIREESGTHFDPFVVEAMENSPEGIREIIEKYSD